MPPIYDYERVDWCGNCAGKRKTANDVSVTLVILCDVMASAGYFHLTPQGHLGLKNRFHQKSGKMFLQPTNYTI